MLYSFYNIHAVEENLDTRALGYRKKLIISTLSSSHFFYCYGPKMHN